MADRPEQNTAKSTPWEKLPVEVIGNILKFLSRSDLRSCRLLNNSTTEEATRQLFSTLEFGPHVDSFKRAILIYHPKFGRYIHNFDYQSASYFYPDRHLDNLRRVVESIKYHQFSSISLTEIGLADALYLSSADEQRQAVFGTAKSFTLTFDGWEFHADIFLQHLDGDVSRLTRNLLNGLSRVQAFTFGFSGSFTCEQGHLDWDARKTMTELMLSLELPELTTLTLENVFTTQDVLIEFLRRHHMTLRSLTISDLILDVTKDFPKHIDVHQGLGSIMRLFVWINRETSLDHVSLQKEIKVEAVSNNNISSGYSVILRRNDEMKRPTMDTVRQKLEDFLCHRDEFPFFFLRPYMDDLAEGKLETKNGIVILGRGGSRTRLEVHPETDKTFYLQRFGIL